MMRPRQLMDVSFRAKVLIPVIAVMVLLLAVTLLVVNFRFQQQTEDNARGELAAANLRFRHSQVVHQDKLRLWFRILADAPKYRAAFMNNPFDPATVRDSLARMMEDEKFADEAVGFVFFTRSDAVAADNSAPMIQQRDGSIPPRALLSSCDLAVQRALQGDPQPDTIRVGDKLFNVISIPVYYPRKSDTWRNRPSMPNVRDSSGTMGTMYLPICLSLSSFVSSETNAIVVDASRSPLPATMSW